MTESRVKVGDKVVIARSICDPDAVGKVGIVKHVYLTARLGVALMVLLPDGRYYCAIANDFERVEDWTMTEQQVVSGFKYLIYNDQQGRFVDGMNNKREAIKRAKQLEQSTNSTITIATGYGDICYETKHKAKAE